jgi:hypothetical protein
MPEKNHVGMYYRPIRVGGLVVACLAATVLSSGVAFASEEAPIIVSDPSRSAFGQGLSDGAISDSSMITGNIPTLASNPGRFSDEPLSTVAVAVISGTSEPAPSGGSDYVTLVLPGDGSINVTSGTTPDLAPLSAAVAVPSGGSTSAPSDDTGSAGGSDDVTSPPVNGPVDVTSGGSTGPVPAGGSDNLPLPPVDGPITVTYGTTTAPPLSSGVDDSGPAGATGP